MKSRNCPVGCKDTEEQCWRRRIEDLICPCHCHRDTKDLPDPVTGYPSFLPPGFGKPKKEEVEE